MIPTKRGRGRPPKSNIDEVKPEENVFDEQKIGENMEVLGENVPEKDIEIPPTIVPMLPTEDKSIKLLKFQNKMQELRDAFNPALPTMAYLDYYIDFEHKMYETVRLNEIPQAIELGSEEAQILRSACEIRDGIPVYKIGRMFPISVNMVADSKRNMLIEETMSSFQLLAWLKDTHITYLTKPRKDNSNPIFTNILLIIGTLFITLFFTYMAWGGA
ncbi:MAG: hypothetical protein PHW73_04805 [Atribacterota bacterium]|nr:hypothetical protein [Atribacterota bacterium]